MSTRREFIKHTAGVVVAAVPAARSGPGLEVPQTGRDYPQRLEASRLATGVTGASFAYWDGRVLHTATAGLRNSVTGDPVTVDTVMHVGSITKVMNAALLMQLVDEGRVALEDPVRKHLPELRLRDKQALERMTCGMLLNHTSGINCDWLPEYGPDQERIVDSIGRCADLDQLFPPGEETSYCNMATVIAGYMVQKLRSKSWYTLIKSRIYEPLGMGHALVDPLEVPRFRASVGDLTDRVTGKLVQSTRPFLAPSFAPAGSTQMTTATDLIAFARALMNGGVGNCNARILSAASAKRMSEPTAEFVPVGANALKVGLGWMISPGGLLSHAGGGPGIRSHLFAHPESGRAAALLTNCDRGDELKKAFLDPILEAWTGIRSAPPHPRPGSVDPRPYVGIYESNIDRYIVSAREGGLALRTRDKIDTFDNFVDQDSAATELVSVGNDTFAGKDTTPGGSDMMVRFIRPGPDGRMRFVSSWERLMARVKS
ncbi:MAG: beta-lactamase family protein [Proteobacteria bacterium]|nr:beta-lactamase family protein [Pseudomonadota bacterium]